MFIIIQVVSFSIKLFYYFYHTCLVVLLIGTETIRKIWKSCSLQYILMKSEHKLFEGKGISQVIQLKVEIIFHFSIY